MIFILSFDFNYYFNFICMVEKIIPNTSPKKSYFSIDFFIFSLAFYINIWYNINILDIFVYFSFD